MGSEIGRKRMRGNICLTFIRNSFKLKQNIGRRRVATFATVCRFFWLQRK